MERSAIGKAPVHAAADIHRRANIGPNAADARHRTVTLVQVVELQRKSADENLGNKSRG
jgi:hypothetical protein